MSHAHHRGLPAVLGLLLTVAGSLLLLVGYSASQVHSDDLVGPFPNGLTANQARARVAYWAQRRGLRMAQADYGPAIEQMREMEAAAHDVHAVATPAPPPWTFIGPQPMLNAAPNFGGPLFTPTPTPVASPFPTPGILPGSYNATGRVTSIAFDPQSSDLFVGTANGGLWRSADLGATFQSLTLTPPSFANSSQAIGAIGISTATVPSTIYVGTGEANNSPDSYYGQGIFQSTDLGNTFAALSFGFFRNAAFSKIVVNPAVTQTVFAAAGLGFTAGRADPDFQKTDAERTSGLFRSTDAGASFVQLPVSSFMIGTGGSTFACSLPGAVDQPCPADDVVIDPGNPKQVYAAIQSADVFASTDGGGTFTAACFSNNSPCTFPSNVKQIGRESLAIAPPGAGAPLACAADSTGHFTTQCATVYAVLGAPDGIEYIGLFRSTDGAVTWSQLTTPTTFPSFTNPVTQVTIDGANARNLSLSGLDQFLAAEPLGAAICTGNKTPLACCTGAGTGCGGSAGTLFFGGVGLYESTSFGASWSFLPGNGGIHSEQHALAFDLNDGNTTFVGNDGGAFKFALSGISNGTATFTPLNNSLSAAQIQSIAPHPTNNSLALAGFQDNGVQIFTGSTPWTSVETGDGGFTLFDHTNPSLAYHTFATTSAGPILSRSTDGGFSWNSALPTSSITQLMRALGDSGANLYPPLANDPAVAGRVLFGTHFIYSSTDGMLTWQRQESADLTGGCNNGTCALQDVEIARSDDTRAWALSIASSASAPTNPATAPFSFSYAPPFATTIKVFNTTQANLNSGAIWNDVTGHFTSNVEFNLPNLQATGIAIDPNHANTAYLSLSGSRAATGIAHVFRTTDFGTSWAPIDGPFGSATSIPDVPVLKVLVERSDSTGGTILAGTDIGIFRSTDSGATWAPFNQNLNTPVPIFDIEENDNNLIFVGTHGRGAYNMFAPVPPPDFLTVNPTSVKFGSAVEFGGNGQALTARVVTLTNPKNGQQARPVLITAAPQISGPPDFTIQVNTCGSGGLVLAPNGSCSVKVVFRPTAPGPRSGTLTFFDNATNSAPTVALSGTGVQGKANVSPLSLNFSPQRVGTRSAAQAVTLSNPNPVAMGIQGISIGGLDPSDFNFTTTCGASLGATRRCTISVVSTPTIVGPRQAALLISDDAIGSPQQVKLNGRGK